MAPFAGDEKALGKPVGSDIRNGKRTLIAVHALESLGRKRAEALKAFGNAKATDAEARSAIELFESVVPIKHAKDIALDYAAKAKAKLDCLPESKDKQFLAALVDFSVGREH